ncbi:MAG: DUF6179 domain-containing protein [Blautia sp.]
MNQRKEYTMEELLPVVTKLAERYTGGEGTSVSYERAQLLMEAVLYCIAEYEGGSRGQLIKYRISPWEAYRAGYRLVREKTVSLGKMYNEMIVGFEDYGMVCLGDVIRRGIPEFLKRYDPEFCPQDTLLTLDYPVLGSMENFTGVDKVYEYTSMIQMEQKFLGQMKSEKIREILRAYHRDYENLVENICSIVLENLAENILTENQMKESSEILEIYIKKIVHNMMERRYEKDRELEAYLCLEVGNIAVRIHNRHQKILK